MSFIIAFTSGVASLIIFTNSIRSFLIPSGKSILSSSLRVDANLNTSFLCFLIFLVSIFSPLSTLGEVTIELEQAIEKVEVRILNALGQEVGKSINTNVAAIQLNLNQQAGYYIIELTANEGKSARFKIVKE